MKFTKLLLVALLYSSYTFANCELLTIAVVTGITSVASYYGYDFYNTVYKCKYEECCTDQYIHFDFHGLNKWFSENLYGQKIAQNMILQALQGHFYNENPVKPLALSFHGTPGTGKNYVAANIAKHVFKYGEDSKYYHFFNGRNSFPLESMVSEYKMTLRSEILKALKKCKTSIFVLDEVDKMPEGVLDILVPFLDYAPYTRVDINDKKITNGELKVNERIYKNHAIFIFLSNTGSASIVQRLMELWESGRKRNDIKLQDFENLIAIGAFNEKGGFRRSDAIQSSVIDHYVPFLPLEELHVRKCVRDMFLRKIPNATDELIVEAMAHVTFGPPPHNLYSNSGCKRLEQKVAAIVYKKGVTNVND